MARYEILYAEDVPHYCVVEIEADSPADALRSAKEYDYGDAAADPDWSNPVCKRIVSIHDEAGNTVAEDVSLDGCFLRYGGDTEERICDAAAVMLATLRSALEWMDTGYGPGTRDRMRNDISAAIAKAEGRAEK